MTNKELQNHLKLYPDDAPVVLFADSIFCNYRAVSTLHIVSVVTNDGENFHHSPQGQTKAIYLGSL